MRTIKYLLPILLLLAACQNKENTPATITPPDEPESVQAPVAAATEPQTKSALQEKMLGVWSSEAYPDGMFDVTDSTFYYGHSFEEHRYHLDGNNITISFPDNEFIGKVSFAGDTLVLDEEDGATAKYWRYKS